VFYCPLPLANIACVSLLLVCPVSLCTARQPDRRRVLLFHCSFFLLASSFRLSFPRLLHCPPSSRHLSSIRPPRSTTATTRRPDHRLLLFSHRHQHPPGPTDAGRNLVWPACPPLSFRGFLSFSVSRLLFAAVRRGPDVSSRIESLGEVLPNLQTSRRQRHALEQQPHLSVRDPFLPVLALDPAAGCFFWTWLPPTHHPSFAFSSPPILI
jgi:hypothetical protein